MFEGRARPPQRALLAGYPSPVRRLFFWYDRLTDWQRVRYALIAVVFLLACAGYMLGLGSTVLLQRVEAEDATLAAHRLLTPVPTPEVIVVAAVDDSPLPTVVATATPRPEPSPTVRAPQQQPTPTLFSAPQIAEKPAVPRSVPVNPPPRVPVVVAPTATAKPRNLEVSPVPAARTPTVATAARTPIPTPRGNTPPLATTVVTPIRTTPQPTPLPTLRIPATAAPASATRTPTPQPRPPTPTPAR
jgi:hypothetical protein